MADGDLISLATVKARLGITDTSQDALLTSLITAASAAVADFCDGYQLTYATLIEEWRDGNDADRIVLLKAPAHEVTSVEINGVPVLAAASVTGAGFRYGDNQVYLTGYRFSRGRRNVKIGYSAGFSSVPPVLEQAAYMTVQSLYSSTSIDPNIAGEAVPGVYSATYRGADAVGFIPAAAQALIANAGYRRYVWGGWP